MKFFIELLPITIFVVAYFFYPDLPAAWIDAFSDATYLELTAGESGDRIYFATSVLIATMLVQCGILWMMRELGGTHLAALVVVVIAGGLTLLLKDPLFIKWKPTVFYWALALAFFASSYIGSRNLVERMFSKAFSLDDAQVWRQLNIAWIGFFLVCGALNLYVAYEFSEEFWVQFKLFGLALGLPILFLLAQGIYLTPRLKD